VTGGRVREEPLDHGRRQGVRRRVLHAYRLRDVPPVDDEFEHAHRGEAGRVGVAVRVPGADLRRGVADGAGEQRARDPDALQGGRDRGVTVDRGEQGDVAVGGAGDEQTRVPHHPERDVRKGLTTAPVQITRLSAPVLIGSLFECRGGVLGRRPYEFGP
jgi:hypothetical protein